MKTYKEIAENALRARDEYLAKKKRRNDMMKKVGAVVLAVALAIGAGFMIKNMLDAGKDVSVAAEPGGNKDGKAIYEINGVTLAAVDRDTDEYKRLDPEGKFWVFKDSNGLVFYTNADIQSRMISNTDPQNTRISTDSEQMVDYLLGITGQKYGRDDVSGVWSEDNYNKEYKLIQNTEFGELILADIYFDKSGMFISGSFNPDGLYDGKDSILTDEEFIAKALEYIKTDLDEEHYQQFVSNYRVEFMPVGLIRGRLYREVVLPYGDDCMMVGERYLFGYSVSIDAKTGELIFLGYLK